MTEKKVSIIVPVYNAEKTINRCVTSLINQSYMNLEIILVDDGSKDASLEICNTYKNRDERIKVIHQENKGVSAARNRGLEVAKGYFVMFCDSDDWVEMNWCEEMVKNYQPENLVMCAYNCYGVDGVKTEICVREKAERILKEDYLSIKSYGSFAPWNKIFSREKIEKYQVRFPENVSLGEDQIFVWRYLKKISGDIIYVPKALNHYYWATTNSLTIKLPLNYYEQCITIFSEILDDIYIHNVRCSEVALDIFYNDSYNQFSRALKRVLDDRSITFIEKVRICNSVMSGELYQQIVKYAFVTTNTIVNFLCKRRICLGIFFLNKIGKY